MSKGATLMRRQAISLRWDTQRWNLGPASSVGEEPWPGHLEVSLDLGVWMLLRFEHDLAPSGPHTLGRYQGVSLTVDLYVRISP